MLRSPRSLPRCWLSPPTTLDRAPAKLVPVIKVRRLPKATCGPLTDLAFGLGLLKGPQVAIKIGATSVGVWPYSGRHASAPVNGPQLMAWKEGAVDQPVIHCLAVEGLSLRVQFQDPDPGGRHCHCPYFAIPPFRRASRGGFLGEVSVDPRVATDRPQSWLDGKVTRACPRSPIRYATKIGPMHPP